MALNIDLTKPLSQEDIDYLLSRCSVDYVNHLKRVVGVVSGSEKPAGKSAGASGAEEPVDAGDGDLEPDDDLIGSVVGYDPTGSTEAEVKAWAETASDEEKAAALLVEQSRSDREARKGVVAILS